jgi:hypothetical protein
LVPQGHGEDHAAGENDQFGVEAVNEEVGRRFAHGRRKELQEPEDTVDLGHFARSKRSMNVEGHEDQF